ncbi:MAG: CDGSH iron-sulfur domain-containing protein [Magnetococcales bacterium]|nr:CDGSH iron-sulfur domain-containing protein [Magnetococcales bacterium]NGZ05983.1 CDGSH iron-sulfur domain-containing protein [Magnetococcales bacterium]
MCGRSGKDPHCDGSHQGTGMQPKRVEMGQSGTVAVCVCHRSGSDPLCDGTHKSIA